MTHVPAGVGIAHPPAGYRPPVLASRPAPLAAVRPVVDAARRRRGRRSLTDAWEDQLSAPWSSFCDDEGLR